MKGYKDDNNDNFFGRKSVFLTAKSIYIYNILFQKKLMEPYKSAIYLMKMMLQEKLLH